MTESASVYDDLDEVELTGVRALLRRAMGSLVVRLGIGALVLFVLAASFLSSAVAERERQRVLSSWGQQLADAAVAYMDAAGTDFVWPGSPVIDPAELDAELASILGIAADAGLVLYREDGTVVYATDHDVIGAKRPELADSLSGLLQGRQVEAQVVTSGDLFYDVVEVDGQRPERVVRSFVPVARSQESAAQGVILEGVRDYDEVRAAVTSMQGIIVGGFVVLYVLLMLGAVPLVSRSDRLLNERTAALRGLLKRQRDTVQQLNTADTLKNRYLTAVSYELRTPMQAIVLLTDRLRTHHDTMPADQMADLTTRLDRNAQALQKRLADLLDVDLLAQGGLEARRQPVDIAQLVRETMAEIDALDHRVTPPGNRIEARVDPGLVGRAVEHLVANAVEHTPAGTAVRVTVEPFEGGTTVVVEDEGPGVPRDRREGIFEPLVSGKAEAGQPGAGIGLTLVRAVAELHGGRAWCEERDGGGARFILRLPDAGGTAGRTHAARIRNQ